MANTLDTFGARDTLNVGDKKVTYYRLSRLQDVGTTSFMNCGTTTCTSSVV